MKNLQMRAVTKVDQTTKEVMKSMQNRLPYPPLKGLSLGHFSQAQYLRGQQTGKPLAAGASRNTFYRRFVPELTLTTCQGIGDIFWVYQKFFPYVGKLNVNIAVTHIDNIVQKRSFPFLKTWPRIGNVTLKLVPGQVYEQLARTKFKMRDVMELGLNEADFSCNRMLEEGMRLEQLDPQYPPAWGIPLPQENPGLEWEKYLSFYICGSKPDFVWSPAQWAECLELLYQKYNLDQPLVIIGASYDADRAREAEGILKAKSNIKTKVYIDLPPQQVHYILAKTQFFVGYQSGLNILADNLGASQLMMYFPYLRPMLYSWCQPHHLADHRFNADTFERTPKNVIDALHVDLHR